MISQKDPRVLEQFRTFVGGLGHIYHRPARHGHNVISDYTLGNHEKVQAVIAMLWNWLSEQKREQASRVLTDLKAYQRSHRNRSKYRTHCPRGHPYNETNTKLRTDKQGVTRRHCLACERFHSLKTWPGGRKLLTASALLEAV